MRIILCKIILLILLLTESRSSNNAVDEDKKGNRSHRISNITQSADPLTYEDQDDKINKEYLGLNKLNQLEKNRIGVESQVSLGGDYTKKVCEVIERSDQFIVCFMYRFNHPKLMHVLANKFIESKNKVKDFCIPLIFLDYRPFFLDKPFGHYRSSVRHLSHNIPLSFIKIQRKDMDDSNKKFHHKIIICKKSSEPALTFIGSANATYEADNRNSEDTVIIQSNELARTILEEFNVFLSSKDVKVYDENKFRDEQTNRFYLKKCIEKIKEQEKSILSSYELRFTGLIESFAISSYFHIKDIYEDSCLELIKNKILESKDNLALIYFQSYFNISGKKKLLSSIEETIRNKNTPLQLIVKSYNNPSKKSYKKTKALIEYNNNNNNNNIYSIDFNPYTQGKFHHKAIIQYFSNGLEPILYTGSFNFSESAINHNSESIIGIRSKDLVEDILCSVLWNSNLADESKVWHFLNRDDLSSQNFYFSQEYKKSKIYYLAENVLSRCNSNLEKYSVRLDICINRLLDTLSQSIGNLARGKSGFKKNFINHYAAFQDYFDPLKDIEALNCLIAVQKYTCGFNKSKNEDEDEKVNLSHEIHNCISSLFEYIRKGSAYLKSQNKSKQSQSLFLKEKIADIKEEFTRNDDGSYTWIDMCLSLQKSIKIKPLQDFKKDKKAQGRIRTMKENKKQIFNLLSCLEDIRALPSSYDSLSKLKIALKPIIKSSLRKLTKDSDQDHKRQKL